MTLTTKEHDLNTCKEMNFSQFLKKNLLTPNFNWQGIAIVYFIEENVTCINRKYEIVINFDWPTEKSDMQTTLGFCGKKHHERDR